MPNKAAEKEEQRRKQGNEYTDHSLSEKEKN